jgi:hypothetical protein
MFMLELWPWRTDPLVRSLAVDWWPVRALIARSCWPPGPAIDASELLERSPETVLERHADKENNPIALNAGHYSGEIDSFRAIPI